MKRNVQRTENFRLKRVLFFMFSDIEPRKIICIFLKQNHITECNSNCISPHKRVIVKTNRIVRNADTDFMGGKAHPDQASCHADKCGRQCPEFSDNIYKKGLEVLINDL